MNEHFSSFQKKFDKEVGTVYHCVDTFPLQKLTSYFFFDLSIIKC